MRGTRIAPDVHETVCARVRAAAHPSSVAEAIGTSVATLQRALSGLPVSPTAATAIERAVRAWRRAASNDQAEVHAA
jgi:hypothetical protein